MKKITGILLILTALVWMVLSAIYSEVQAAEIVAPNSLPNFQNITTSGAKHCHGKFVNPITDVCWSCLFPITIGSAKVVSGSNPDTSNPSIPVCICPEPIRIGIAVGFWEPINLVDITRHPFCLVNLGGIQLDLGKHYGMGEVDNTPSDQGGSFYYAHWYVYPLMYWLNIITDVLCMQKSDFDIAYLTELDPMWKDDEISFIINPEAVIFGNPIAQAACAADATAAFAHLPLDSLFWCAGSHGSMYPLMGKVQEHAGGVQSSTLLTERMTYKMHRQGLVYNSVGENAPALCSVYPTPIMPKSRFRYQMVNPLPTASSSSGGCKPFGHTTALWGSMKEFPYKGEDFGYLIWKKRNCCFL